MCSIPTARRRTSIGDLKHVLAWAYHPSHGDKFYLYRDRSEKVEAVGPDVMTENGHCTYPPCNR
ncbi:MAG: hypothetical protein R2748_17405 [Bryobacterales bacterium]